jgi:hypothetical protein
MSGSKNVLGHNDLIFSRIGTITKDEISFFSSGG